MIEGKETDDLSLIVSSGRDEVISLFEITEKGVDSEVGIRERA